MVALFLLASALWLFAVENSFFLEKKYNCFFFNNHLYSCIKDTDNHHSTPAMALPDILSRSDILPIVASFLGICNIKCIRAASKELSTSINADARHMSMSETTATYAHADLLKNGAFRVKSRVGLHYADIRALPGIRRLHSTPLPIVSMLFRGVSYIGRFWSPGEPSWTARMHELFHPFSDMLSAGNICIDNLYNIRLEDSNVLMLELTLDRGFVRVDAGIVYLDTPFEPIFESVVGHVPQYSRKSVRRGCPNTLFQRRPQRSPYPV